MKILVLGNGFDIDHDLPTSYRAFLNFCNVIVDNDNAKERYEKLTEKQKKYIDIIKKDTALYGEFRELLSRNMWLNYFNQQAEKLNWIDFEREIMDVVMEFTNLEKLMMDKGWNTYQIEQNARIHEVMRDLDLSKIDAGFVSLITLSMIHETLCKHFKNFAIALELYIGRFVNETIIDGVAPDIIEYDADEVLTFNYSDTYERIYGGVKWNQCISYVHGKAQVGDGSKDANIVLGITSPENIGTSYVEFEKYFQRITKKTGNEYKKWLESTENITVAFFGHSLDATDSDVIKDFFDYEKAKIKIYYYNDESYQNIVANLIKIIGKEELIRNVYGNHPKVEFIRQKEHQSATTGGVEIARDIRMLYRIHLYEEKEIDALVNKIKAKVQSEDAFYFYSQRKTISLFEALSCQNIDGFSVEEFGKICDKLDYEARIGKKIRFNDEDWLDFTSWGDEIPCTLATSRLIEKVNEKNAELYWQNKKESPYMYVTRLNSEEEIRNAFVMIFSESGITDKYWRELAQLLNFMEEDAPWDNVLKEIYSDNSIPIHVRLRAKHFWDVYMEHSYDLYMMEQMNMQGD